MTRRVATLLGIAGLAVALLLLARDNAPLAGDSARARALRNPTAADLDTVQVRGIRVEASVDGVVAEVDGDDAAWVVLGGDAFRLRFPEAHGLREEDRVLATGRLRARGGRRWLAVRDWARVRAEVRPPAALPEPPARPEAAL